jgi:uncharacterized protein
MNEGGPMKAKKEFALITGATSGIGYDFANIFAQKGYNLFLASRNQEKLKTIKAAFEKKYGILVRIMPIDLGKPQSGRRVYEETLQQKIEINVLVNNAGFALAGDHTDLDMCKVEEMIQLNVTTLTELSSLFGHEMKKKRQGYILNIASTAAYQPAPYIAAYGGTKSYVLNFSEALAKELEDYNVVVTCLSPGPTDTNFFDAVGIAEKKDGLWAKRRRMESREVAEIGVNALFAKKLSLVSGSLNSLFAFSTRLAPRSAAASIAKKVIKLATSD